MHGPEAGEGSNMGRPVSIPGQRAESFGKRDTLKAGCFGHEERIHNISQPCAYAKALGLS